jgi:hypothetical protein
MTSSQSHIIPVRRSRSVPASLGQLLDKCAIYIQPVNYPTVPRGTERLRITPTPFHNGQLIDDLANALYEVWDTLGLNYLPLTILRVQRHTRRPLMDIHGCVLESKGIGEPDICDAGIVIANAIHNATGARLRDPGQTVGHVRDTRRLARLCFHYSCPHRSPQPAMRRMVVQSPVPDH